MISNGIEVERWWWYASRATGIIAAACIVASVVWGILIATRVIDRKGMPAHLLDLHKHLGALTLIFTGLHMVTLVGDNYLKFAWKELLVPGGSQWKTVPVAAGVIAFWCLLIVQASSAGWARKLPRRWWRRIHYLSYIAVGAALWHAASAGTDVSSAGFIVAAIGATMTLLFFVAWRVLHGDARSVRAAAKAASSGDGNPSAVQVPTGGGDH